MVVGAPNRNALVGAPSHQVGLVEGLGLQRGSVDGAGSAAKAATAGAGLLVGWLVG